MPQPLNPEQRATRDTLILRLHAEGKSRNDIHRETGIGAGVISDVVKNAGLSFDRSQVASATRARNIDLKARKARVLERALARVEHLQDRLEAPIFKAKFRGDGGAEHTVELDYVPTDDELRLSDTINRYLHSIVKLEEADDGRGDVKSMLADLARALGLAV